MLLRNLVQLPSKSSPCNRTFSSWSLARFTTTDRLLDTTSFARHTENVTEFWATSQARAIRRRRLEVGINSILTPTWLWSTAHSFHPWVQGPNTAHVAWKRQGSIAGLVGGPAGQLSSTSSPGNPSVVYAGRCYQTYTKLRSLRNIQRHWQCYDLRTGQVYCESP